MEITSIQKLGDKIGLLIHDIVRNYKHECKAHNIAEGVFKDALYNRIDICLTKFKNTQAIYNYQYIPGNYFDSISIDIALSPFFSSAYRIEIDTATDITKAIKMYQIKYEFQII